MHVSRELLLPETEDVEPCVLCADPQHSTSVQIE